MLFSNGPGLRPKRGGGRTGFSFLPLLEAVGGRQHPTGADQDPPTQKPLSWGPPVPGEDGGLPRVGGDVREEASFDAELGLLVLSQATGDWGGKGRAGVRPVGLGEVPEPHPGVLTGNPGFYPLMHFCRLYGGMEPSPRQ